MSWADEYLAWDNVEPVTLTIVQIGGTDVTAAVSHALKEALKWHDYHQMGANSLGSAGLSKETTAWLLPKTLLDGKEPKLDSVIERASGEQWIVRGVDYQVADQVFRCVCTRVKD